MKFYPINGYIQIEPISSDRASSVLLPEDARSEPSISFARHIAGYDFLGINGAIGLFEMDKPVFLIVENHLIEKIEFEGQEIYIIPKMGLKGIIQNEMA